MYIAEHEKHCPFLKQYRHDTNKKLFVLFQMKVMDNNLFTIEPKKGSMEPGECKTVTFTYKHTMAGTDRLPVLLKLARGREILVSIMP